MKRFFLFFICVCSVVWGEVSIVYDPAQGLEPDDEALDLGFWTAGAGEAGVEAGVLVTEDPYDDTYETTPVAQQYHARGVGRTYRRRFTQQEMNDQTDFRAAVTMRVDSAVGGPAAAGFQLTTRCGRTVGVGFERDPKSGKEDRVVFFADDGGKLEGFSCYEIPQWLGRVKELGSLKLDVSGKRTYVLEILRNGDGADDDEVRFSVEGSGEQPVLVRLAELPSRTTVAGFVFGHQLFKGWGKASWYRIAITTTGTEPKKERARRIGTNRQMFMDDWMIEKTDKLERIVEQPRKYHGNPVLTRTYPWDAARTDMYGTCVYDKRDGKLKLFYSAANLNWHEKSPTDKYIQVAYAESVDGGLNWERPMMSEVPYQDYSKTNIIQDPVTSCSMGPCVFIDEHDPDPARRYKIFTADYGISQAEAELMKSRYGCYAGWSADGIHWDPKNYLQVNHYASDTSQCAIWDERIGKYVAYVRYRCQYGRSVARIESEDFLHWTEPELIYLVKTKHSFYSMGVTPYEGIYIGTPWVYWHFSGKERRADSHLPSLSPVLAMSRDGWGWKAISGIEKHKEYIATEGPGSGYDRQIRMGNSIVPLDDKILFVFGMSDDGHEANMRVDVGVAFLRLDGFAPLLAEWEEGTLVTQPFFVEGNRLIMNADCDAIGGEIEVEMLDEQGQVIAGYSKADCDVFKGDDVRHIVSWKGKNDIGSMKGKIVKLRIGMKLCKLYSFGLAEE